jgi:hypothetical protein
MALHFPLLLNNHSIGYFYAQRIDGDGTPNSKGTYLVEIESNGEVWKTHLAHRYGDGAWVLVGKAISAWKKRNKVAKGFTTVEMTR